MLSISSAHLKIFIIQPCHSPDLFTPFKHIFCCIDFDFSLFHSISLLKTCIRLWLYYNILYIITSGQINSNEKLPSNKRDKPKRYFCAKQWGCRAIHGSLPFPLSAKVLKRSLKRMKALSMLQKTLTKCQLEIKTV